MKKVGKAAPNEDDDMAFLDSLIKEKNTCGVDGCSISAKISMFACPYCKINYCSSHRYLFAHNCTEDGKKPTITKATTSQKQALNSKLTDMKKTRQKKPKDENKK